MYSNVTTFVIRSCCFSKGLNPDRFIVDQLVLGGVYFIFILKRIKKCTRSFAFDL